MPSWLNGKALDQNSSLFAIFKAAGSNPGEKPNKLLSKYLVQLYSAYAHFTMSVNSNLYTKIDFKFLKLLLICTILPIFYRFQPKEDLLQSFFGLINHSALIQNEINLHNFGIKFANSDHCD